MIKTPLSTMIGGAFWTPCSTILGSSSQNLTQLIKSLFANQEQGFAYDPNDLTTLYQYAAGTVPVTTAGQPVGLTLDKSKGLVLGSELVTNGDFNTDLTGWLPTPAATISWQAGSMLVTRATTGTYPAGSQNLNNLVVGKAYKITCDFSNPLGLDVYLGFGGFLNVARSTATSGKLSCILFATTTSHNLVAGMWATSGTVGQSVSFDNVSVKELSGNHAYQSVSAMRPLLVAAPQRLDYDAVDDKLITNLPAQLSGCTVIRSVPNVGTQILTNQTIPTPYNDNIDNCGLIVINRALTATETAQITKLFNKAAGV